MKPVVFVGSSSELLPVARALEHGLESTYDVRVWDSGVFEIASTTLSDLVSVSRESDLAVFVFGKDDLTMLRDELHFTTRDNVIFELGLFMGAMAANRTFFIVPGGCKDLRIATDLVGVTAARYDLEAVSKDPVAAIAGVCSEIQSAIDKVSASPGLSGDWLHVWTDPEGVSQECKLDLLQVGAHVRGRYSWDRNEFLVVGTIERGDHLTVEYRAAAGPHGYSGTIHFVIRPDGRTLVGRWAGWSGSGGGVNSGECEWRRLAV